MPEKDLAKRACQRCEYLNPRQALYCLRCGEIFRPVLAETPYEYLRPEREQRRAEVLGRAALEDLRRGAGPMRWRRLVVLAAVLAAAYGLCYSWSKDRTLRRSIAGDPALLHRAVWQDRKPDVPRPKSALWRPKAVQATLAEPWVLAWFFTVGPIGLYLIGLGLSGVARRELEPASLLAPVDVFYPLGGAWAALLAGRRPSSWRRGAPLTGPPAVLVAAAYFFWGLATFFVLPAGVYEASLRKEGWAKGLKALGMELPPRTWPMARGLMADTDGTLTLKGESVLGREDLLGFYKARAGGAGRLEPDRFSGPSPDGGVLTAVALEPSPQQKARGLRSVVYLTLTGAEDAAGPPEGGPAAGTIRP